MDNQRGKNDSDLAWLAGIVEGEGSFAINFNRRPTQQRSSVQLFPRIIITNTDETMIHEALRILQDHNVSGFIRTVVRRAPYRTVYHLTLHGFRRVSSFLDLITPYLRTDYKRFDAVTVRNFVQSRLSRPHKSEYSDEEIEWFRILRAKHGHSEPVEILRDFKSKLRIAPKEDKVRP